MNVFKQILKIVTAIFRVLNRIFNGKKSDGE